jgi:hypothetical protein
VVGVAEILIWDLGGEWNSIFCHYKKAKLSGMEFKVKRFFNEG